MTMQGHAKRSAWLAIAIAASLGGAAQSAMAADGEEMRAMASRANFTALQEKDTYDRFIVYYNEQSSGGFAATNSVSKHLDQIHSDTGMNLSMVRTLATGGHLVETQEKLSKAQAEDLMVAFGRSANVAYIEPDVRMTIQFTPNDTTYNQQWHYFEATGGLNLPNAWDRATGQGVTVAVLDTGIASHSDLNGNVVGGYDFISSAATARDGNGRDSNPNDEGDWFSANECGVPFAQNSSWHGTHVAGTVAAVTNNNFGVAGVAFDSQVVPVRVLGRCGGSTSDIAEAIIWASGGSVAGVPNNPNPAEVINMSLGGGGACGSTFQNAINSAVNRGSTVVVAAGNSNQNVSTASPANCNNVIAVAALDRQGNRASYSNFGNLIDITAPGGETNIQSNGVRSTLNSGTTTPAGQSYAFYQGTSMAAPHIAGLVAMMIEADSSLTPAQIETLLEDNARSIPGSCSGGCGAGVADAEATIDAILDGTGGGGGPTQLTSGVPVTGLSGGQGQQQFFTIQVPAGASNLNVAMAGGSGDGDLYVRFGSAPTLNTFDCRPFAGGNNESCPFPNPQAGTWHVMVNGFSAFSGASLTATVTGGGGGQQSFFENTSNFTINSNATVESPISVSRSGNAPSDLRVGVDIKHTYRGDLVIDLVAPDGSTYRLKNSNGRDGADNVITTYTVNASSESANGTWRLRVRDVFNGDDGFIDDWSLQF